MEDKFVEFKNALKEAGLENAAKGVVFPWGVKIADIEGIKHLQPMTPEEYKLAVEQETGKTLSEEELKNPRCVYAGRCISQGCKQVGGSCHMHSAPGTGWYCLCNY